MPATAKTYVGSRSEKGAITVKVIDVDGTIRPLPEAAGLFPITDVPFDWGDSGAASAKLALAILFDLLSFDGAVHWHQRFKFDRIAKLPRTESWSMSEGEVREWLASVVEARDSRGFLVP